MRLVGFLATTFSFPAFPKSICLPSRKALFMRLRIVLRAFLDWYSVRPVRSEILAVNSRLVIFMGFYVVSYGCDVD